MTYDCNCCGKEFEGEPHENVTCPHCGAKYEWDEFCEFDDDGNCIDETYTYVRIDG